MGEERLSQWFDSVERHGLAEWNSAAYYPIDFIGLLALEHLGDGAIKARAVATPFAARLRHAVGLRPLQAAVETKAKADKAALPSFKQYREKDGQFYFKLADAKGRLLLQSLGYASPKECGAAIAQLKAQGWSTSAALHAMAAVAEDASAAEADAALQVLRDAA